MASFKHMQVYSTVIKKSFPPVDFRPGRFIRVNPLKILRNIKNKSFFEFHFIHFTVVFFKISLETLIVEVTSS